jgi:RNA polymerase sigma factor (sigma-70 family)
VEANISGQVIPLSEADPSPIQTALEELDHVYRFIFRRVGNSHDAEDLTQQVALKALPRINGGRPAAAIRAYLYATARTELAAFWAARFGLAVEELSEEAMGLAASDDGDAADGVLKQVRAILDRLPANYSKLLELRFLRGYSTHELAREFGISSSGVRVMQLRALRAAARLTDV